ncbi:MAG: hypothetical protein WBL11_05585 [Bacteroidales bacterium]|jgi:ribosome maturation factor RimP|nr:hypothetical protein [Bacteroidales bacterium]MDI9575942.1 hypothetical protein [Bacteroidota bacterium]MDD2593918.1 hypothetical protein [Bacteroidales bacterium]MDD3756195.1 hypothetical protein [Bacteroidales bacterium]MDY0401461.1 hypothetical protein [Bacteroidales bacterium]
MIDKEYIEKIVNEVTEGTHIFLTKLVVDTHGRIKIFIDGDSNVTIDDCIKISRYVEKKLSLIEDDFQLDVSSHGIGNPLINPRQYPKHIGHLMQIKTINNEIFRGKLIKYENEKLTLEIKKNKEKKDKIIDLSEIKECKEVLKY